MKISSPPHFSQFVLLQVGGCIVRWWRPWRPWCWDACWEGFVILEGTERTWQTTSALCCLDGPGDDRQPGGWCCHVGPEDCQAGPWPGPGWTQPPDHCSSDKGGNPTSYYLWKPQVASLRMTLGCHHLTLCPNHAWQSLLFDKAGNSGRVDCQGKHDQAQNQVDQGVRTPVAFFFFLVVVCRSWATTFVVETFLFRLEHWEGGVWRLGGVWDWVAWVAPMVAREAKQCNYLDQGEDARQDGRDDGEDKSGDHHASVKQKHQSIRPNSIFVFVWAPPKDSRSSSSSDMKILSTWSQWRHPQWSKSYHHHHHHHHHHNHHHHHHRHNHHHHHHHLVLVTAPPMANPPETNQGTEAKRAKVGSPASHCHHHYHQGWISDKIIIKTGDRGKEAEGQ